MKHIKLPLILLLTLIMIASTACSGGAKPTIRVADRLWTEQLIIGQMYRMLLEDAGFNVELTSLASHAEVHKAIVNDEVDVTSEYTGSSLVVTLDQEYDPSMSREDVYNLVKKEYADRYDLTLLDQTHFNNTYVLITTQEVAQKYGLKTMSDVAAKADQLVFGVDSDFVDRPDGLPGLQKRYGGFNFKDVKAFDTGLRYQGLIEGAVDVTTGYGTDGQIAANNLVRLTDDKNFWPPYPLAPVVRADVLKDDPKIAETLNQLAPLLDNQTMSELNWQVSGEKREADEVAHDFLVQHNLLTHAQQ